MRGEASATNSTIISSISISARRNGKRTASIVCALFGRVTVDRRAETFGQERRGRGSRGRGRPRACGRSRNRRRYRSCRHQQRAGGGDFVDQRAQRLVFGRRSSSGSVSTIASAAALALHVEREVVDDVADRSVGDAGLRRAGEFARACAAAESSSATLKPSLVSARISKRSIRRASSGEISTQIRFARHRGRRGRATGATVRARSAAASRITITLAFGDVDADFDDGRRDEHVDRHRV